MEASELVNLAMKKVKAEKPADLARALELGSYASPRRVARWLDGENEPDYKATLALLRMVGLLREKPSAGRRSAVQDQSAPQGGIEEAAAVIVTEMNSGFEKIDQRLRALEKQRVGGVPRSQPRAAEAASR